MGPHASTHASGGADPVTPASIGAALASRVIAASGLATGGGDLSADRVISVPAASAAEANAGTAEDKAVTPAGLAAFSRVKTGAFAKDLSIAGAQVVTGVGFRPAALLVIAATIEPAPRPGFSLGVVGGGLPEAWSAYDNGGLTPDTWGYGGGVVTVRPNVGDSSYAQARVTSLDADGFALDWQTGGTPAGLYQIIWIAWR